jgi:hypothetical protein
LAGLNLGGEMVVLPAGVAQVGDFYFETLLKLWAFVEHQFCVEC